MLCGPARRRGRSDAQVCVRICGGCGASIVEQRQLQSAGRAGAGYMTCGIAILQRDAGRPWRCTWLPQCELLATAYDARTFFSGHDAVRRTTMMNLCGTKRLTRSPL